MEELTEEKNNYKNLMREINNINGKLAKTQRLLSHSQCNVKKTNWQNSYIDFQFDYYNGLNFFIWIEFIG